MWVAPVVAPSSWDGRGGRDSWTDPFLECTVCDARCWRPLQLVRPWRWRLTTRSYRWAGLLLRAGATAMCTDGCRTDIVPCSFVCVLYPQELASGPAYSHLDYARNLSAAIGAALAGGRGRTTVTITEVCATCVWRVSSSHAPSHPVPFAPLLVGIHSRCCWDSV